MGTALVQGDSGCYVHDEPIRLNLGSNHVIVSVRVHVPACGSWMLGYTCSKACGKPVYTLGAAGQVCGRIVVIPNTASLSLLFSLPV